MSKHFVIIASLLSVVPEVFADGIKIDKVYNPYVQPSEREIEIRSNFFEFDDSRDISFHRLGLGYGVTPKWFVELYAIGEQADNASLSLEAVELEAKWQLGEQGEYNADWGILFELEDQHHEDAFEFASKLLTAKDFNRWTLQTNFGIVYEWGADVDNELETTFAAQLRYRQRPTFEPGLEIYIGQDTQGIGPVLQGAIRASGRKSVHWEAGIIAGLKEDTPDYTLRLLLEFEY